MAATFHVFVDGAVDASPDGLRKLATAMAARYGLPSADLVARLSKGRFRVKASVDQATADSYLRDLTAIGARCTLEPADPGARATVPPATAARATAPPARTTTPPTNTAPPRAATPSLGPPRASTPPPVGGYQSGLAAAFSNDTSSASLGALAGDLSSFSLGSVDGVAEEEPPPPAAAFVPPEELAPKPVAKPKPAAAAKAAKPKDEPLDLFAPPEAQGEAAFTVELAPDEHVRHEAKRSSMPPPNVEVAAPAARSRGPHPPSFAPANDPMPAQRTETGEGTPRARFAAGVVLAILIGFIPAHLIASMREKSAFKSIDDKVELAQQQADTPEAYAALDRLRDEQQARKEGDRRDIMFLALAIWGVVGGGLAYVWFRRIPWDR